MVTLAFEYLSKRTLTSLSLIPTSLQTSINLTEISVFEECQQRKSGKISQLEIRLRS